MILSRSALVIVTLGLTLGLAACGGGGGGGGSEGSGSTPTATPTATATASPTPTPTAEAISHNAGLNCIRCHTAGQDDDAVAVGGDFTIAGTINGPAGSRVLLYVQNTNTLIATLTTDSLGNFYTTEAIEYLTPEPGQTFAEGVDVAISGPDGSNYQSMVSIVAYGGNSPHLSNSGCNACHSTNEPTGNRSALSL